MEGYFVVIEGSEKNCQVFIDNEYRTIEVCQYDERYYFQYWHILGEGRTLYTWDDTIEEGNGPLETYDELMCEEFERLDDDIFSPELPQQWKYVIKTVREFFKRDDERD